jgi:hypothetical protein
MDSTLSATLSAVVNNTSFLNILFESPLVRYLLSPAVAFGFVLWVASMLLGLGGVREKFKRALDDIKDLRNNVDKLVRDVMVIKTHEVESGGIAALAFAPGSPLKLLSKGLHILKASGFEKIFEQNKQWFIDETKKYNPKSLSDIDDACFEIVSRCGTDNKFANYKEISFENGVTLDILLKIISIYLRDEMTKEITFEED